MTNSDEDDLPGKLRHIIETIDVANALTEPLTDSIENLLYLSAAALRSEEASVIVRDGEAGDMQFLAATGKVADRLVGMKIPSGKGIAGFVFSSGQPMAVADVGREETFYAEVDKQTGYNTRMILATPLRFKGEILGVLEYVNRSGDPPYENFTPDEMDKAALYADAIASLVNAYESAKTFRRLGLGILKEETGSEYGQLRDWIKTFRESGEHRDMLELAVLIREIASRGENERALCREILESVLRYSDANSGTSFLSY